MPDDRWTGARRVAPANDEKAMLEGPPGPCGPQGEPGRDGKDANSRGFRLQIIRDEDDRMIEVIATPL